jgi:hypothetical protein
MSAIMQGVRFSFMTSGPRLAVQLPSAFTRLPKLSSPLNIYVTAGARSFDFIPADQDDEMSEYLLLGTLADRDARRVELYERTDPPTVWWLRWPLSQGALYSHLREEDGLEMAETVVSNLAIVEQEPNGLPVLLPEHPLSRAVAAAPGYQESAAFSSTDSGVTLSRPGFLPLGKRVRLPIAHEYIMLRAGAMHGIEVSAVMPADGQAEGEDFLSALLASIEET